MVDNVVNGFADEILRTVVQKVGNIIRHIFGLALCVDDKQEAVKCFQKERAQHLCIQHCRSRRRDIT